MSGSKTIPWGPKLRFFGGHLILSVAVFVILLLLIWNFWYPRPFFWTDGGSDGLGTVAFVDIVIGPFLSLVLFNPVKSKRELTLDIGLVVLLQIGAMGYGVYTVYHGRPAVLVHADGLFQVVDHSPFETQGVTPDQFEKFGDEIPPVVHLGVVQTKEEGGIFTKWSLQEGLQSHMIFVIYRNFYENLEKVKSQRLDIKKGMEVNAELAQAIEKSVKKLGGSVDDYWFYPYVGRFRDGLIVLNQAGQRVDFIFKDAANIPKVPEIKAPAPVEDAAPQTPSDESGETGNETPNEKNQ